MPYLTLDGQVGQVRERDRCLLGAREGAVAEGESAKMGKVSGELEQVHRGSIESEVREEGEIHGSLGERARTCPANRPLKGEEVGRPADAHSFERTGLSDRKDVPHSCHGWHVQLDVPGLEPPDVAAECLAGGLAVRVGTEEVLGTRVWCVPRDRVRDRGLFATVVLWEHVAFRAQVTQEDEILPELWKSGEGPPETADLAEGGAMSGAGGEADVAFVEGVEEAGETEHRRGSGGGWGSRIEGEVEDVEDEFRGEAAKVRSGCWVGEVGHAPDGGTNVRNVAGHDPRTEDETDLLGEGHVVEESEKVLIKVRIFARGGEARLDLGPQGSPRECWGGGDSPR